MASEVEKQRLFLRGEEVADEYRIAYEQLKRCEADQVALLDQLQRDRDLAEKRYQTARRRFLELALGEDDEFLAAGEE